MDSQHVENLIFIKIALNKIILVLKLFSVFVIIFGSKIISLYLISLYLISADLLNY